MPLTVTPMMGNGGAPIQVEARACRCRYTESNSRSQLGKLMFESSSGAPSGGYSGAVSMPLPGRLFVRALPAETPGPAS